MWPYLGGRFLREAVDLGPLGVVWVDPPKTLWAWQPRGVRDREVRGMPTRKRTLGDLDGATRLVWKGLKRAAQLLDHPDPQVALRAAHAVFQGATLTPSSRRCGT